MGTPIGGTAFIKADGRQYALRGNLIISGDPIEREGVAGGDAVHGFLERPRVPSISGDVSMTPDLSIPELRAMADVTVTAELINGKVYVLRNAWTADAMELNVGDGQVGVVWQGMAGDWM